MPCFAAMPLSSSQYDLLAAALARSMTRASQEGSCTPTKPHSLAHLHMSLKFCRCGPLPANCARKIAGPLMVFTLAPSQDSELDGKLREVIRAHLRGLEHRPCVRLLLLVEVMLHAVGVRGADYLLPIDGAFAHRHGGSLVRIVGEFADVLDVQRRD